MIEFTGGGLHVRIPNAAMRVITKYASRSVPQETGGVLIGSYDDMLHIATITKATGAPKDSACSRLGFIRGIAGTKAILKRAADRGEYYLGEWHTHPRASPEPSRTDLEQMLEIAMSKSYNCPEPILIIAGGNPPGAKVSMTIITAQKTMHMRISEREDS